MKRITAILFVISVIGCGVSKNSPDFKQSVKLNQGLRVSIVGNQFGTSSIERTEGNRSIVVDLLEHNSIRISYYRPGETRSHTPSPMVSQSSFGLKDTLGIIEHDGLEGVALKNLTVLIDDNLCVSLRKPAHTEQLALVCSPQATAPTYLFNINSPKTTQAYGLGQQFFNEGNNSNWLGRERSPGTALGNRMVDFEGGAVGNVQVPVLLTYQSDTALAYFLDSPEAQTWSLSSNPWSITGSGLSQAMYIFAGNSHEEVRSSYMKLTGRPPVPPKSAFGLWLSEYGYDNWAEAESKIISQYMNTMPVDGVVLDLQWFGGIENREMGSLTWDTTHFPDPTTRLAAWRDNWGVESVLIEESYIDVNKNSFAQLRDRGYLVKESQDGAPTSLNSWWGSGGMIDWSHQQGAAYWHTTKRTPLINDGVLGHWTDLGEPEDYDSKSYYADTYENSRHEHKAIHNLYNFYWSKSIFDGYVKDQPQKRPWILSRSGTSGSQRFGVNIWSGDIGSNARSLKAHLQTQMHMSMSGFDYYSSDIGGFHHGTTPKKALDDLYTVWLANGALFDIPLRAHTENLCNCKETAPSLMGDIPSNRFNVQLRYKLFPYYYSLAHHAHQTGAALFPPLAYFHPNDAKAVDNNNMKYIGPSLLARSYSDPSISSSLDSYIPAGDWLSIHDEKWIRSTGQTVKLKPTAKGFTTLPLLAKAGAIIPMMHVDEQTTNMHGRRRDNSVHNELIVMVAASDIPSEFTLFEDDGRSTAYIHGELTQTRISQQMKADAYVINIDATKGQFNGSLAQRSYQLELYTQKDDIQSILLNGKPIPLATSEQEFNTLAHAAYRASAILWKVKTRKLSTTAAKAFTFARQ